MAQPPTPSKTKRFRSPNKIKPTGATAKFFRYFLQPFISAFNYAEGQEERVEGYNAFFNVSCRRVIYCRAKYSFKMPGGLWCSSGSPFPLIFGTGYRYVKKGDGLVLRVDKNSPDRVDIEYEEQVFVLKAHEYDVIAEHMEIVA